MIRDLPGSLRAILPRPIDPRSACLAVALLAGGCDPCEGAGVQIASPDGEIRLSVCAEVADTEAARRQGLAGRAALGDGEGMLFELPITGEACITGEGMEFPIDVVFIDGASEVVEVASLGASDGRSICEPGVRRVLEVTSGVASSVAPGDRVTVRGVED